MIKVVDLSHHQGKVDFDKLKAQGVSAVFIKCTQGTGYKDPMYLEYKSAIRARGMVLGMYHFAGDLQNDGKTTIAQDPIKEAEHFLKNIGDILPGDIVILDWEPTICDKLSQPVWVEKFLDYVSSKVGFKPLFYTYESRLLKFDFSSVYKKDYGLWIADYGINDGVPHGTPVITPWKFFVLHQYTSKASGKQYGVSSLYVDLSQGNITIDTLKKYGKPLNIPMPEPTTPDVKEQYHRYGHMDKVFVKLGDKVKKGQDIGTIGDGNGNYKGSAHVHYDCPNCVLTNWWDFPIGETREYVRDRYTSPYLFIDKDLALPTICDHLGWDYLQRATYTNGICFHPGCDINGKGAGSADFGQVIKATRSGEVVYCYSEEGRNHGWGKLLVIKEGPVDESPVISNEDIMYQDFFKKICKVLNFDSFGDNMNEGEASKIIDKVKEISDSLSERNQKIVDLTNENAILKERILSLQEKPKEVTPQEPEKPTVIAVVSPQKATPKLTLGDLLKKIFKLN